MLRGGTSDMEPVIEKDDWRNGKAAAAMHLRLWKIAYLGHRQRSWNRQFLGFGTSVGMKSDRGPSAHSETLR